MNDHAGSMKLPDGAYQGGVRRPVFTDEEIRLVREGENGILRSLPPRCYYDPELYEFEVEHVLKKNWLCVGRTDWAAKAGDYYTREMFGEPVLIIRDRNNQLHALINVCQHRWAQIVPDGSGNTKLLVCPNHSWTFELDGRLRGVTVQDIPGFDKKSCRMPELRLEVWQGFVFINFDDAAEPLAPQVAGLEKYFGHYGLEDYVTADRMDYETSWNYKFSLENGYEGYHVEGVHKSIAQGTALEYVMTEYSKNWGLYISEPLGRQHPFGPPAWLSESEIATFNDPAFFFALYPSLIVVVHPHQILMITNQHRSVDSNLATTSLHVPKWAYDRPNAAEEVKKLGNAMRYVQNEDAFGCALLQKGVRSHYNRTGIIHPIEAQLSHYYNWFMDQYLS